MVVYEWRVSMTRKRQLTCEGLGAHLLIHTVTSNCNGEMRLSRDGFRTWSSPAGIKQGLQGSVMHRGQSKASTPHQLLSLFCILRLLFYNTDRSARGGMHRHRIIIIIITEFLVLQVPGSSKGFRLLESVPWNAKNGDTNDSDQSAMT